MFFCRQVPDQELLVVKRFGTRLRCSSPILTFVGAYVAGGLLKQMVFCNYPRREGASERVAAFHEGADLCSYQAFVFSTLDRCRLFMGARVEAPSDSKPLDFSI